MRGQEMEAWVLVYDDTKVEWDAVPPSLDTKLHKLKARRVNIHDVSIGSDASWILTYHSGQLEGMHSFNSSYEESSVDLEDLWDLLEEEDKGLNRKGHYVQDIAFTPEMDWVLIYDDYHALWKNINVDLQATIMQLYKKKEKIRDLAFSQEGAWVLVSGTNKIYTSKDPGLPKKLIKTLGELQEKNHQINHIEFHHINEGWLVVYDKNLTMWENIPDSLGQRLKELSNSSHTIQEITLWGLPDLPIDGKIRSD